MDISPFLAMQKAVDIVNTSPHPTNKIAAALMVGGDVVTSTNIWPSPIFEKLGMEARIGNSSGTVHAEVACVLKAPLSNGASLFITDPFCPNCAKNVAEAGVKNIYIDHKGFVKDFAQRRSGEFESMSMRITARAGISVYEIWRREEKIIPLYEPPSGYKPPQDYPVEITKAPHHEKAEADFFEFTKHKIMAKLHDRFACAYAQDRVGSGFLMFAKTHPAIGYTEADDPTISMQQEGKYSFILEPVNRLIMTAARHGLKLSNGLIYSAQVPTSREQVNMVAAGLNTIIVGDEAHGRDEHAIVAKDLLSSKGIIIFKSL